MKLALLGQANSIHLRRWARALAERGHRVAVVSQQACAEAELPPEVERVSLPWHGRSGYFANALPLRRWLRDWRPDLLHAHYASGYGTTSALAAFRPTLLSVWGSDVYDFPYQGVAQGWLLRRNLRCATAVASTSHAMAEQVRRLVPQIGEIAVTPFGIDLEQFGPVEHDDRFVPASAGSDRLALSAAITIGCIKTLAPEYGIDLLLRAFAGLCADPGLDAIALRLVIVGGGPEHRALQALASDLGIAERTSFTGAVAHADVPKWLRRLDIYAAPSRMESFGVAVLEASACGLPVVVSDAGGLPEVVCDGETGLVVPRDDVSALQAALKRLVLAPELRRELGRRGRQHVERQYEWQHCVDLMEQCYERTLALARRR